MIFFQDGGRQVITSSLVGLANTLRGYEDMKKAADILYLLATYSVRSGFLDKASAYAEVGIRLFPRDQRLLEIHIYLLVLCRHYAEAEQALAATRLSSRNLEYLRSRVAMLTSQPQSVVQACLRRYLAA
ncbi:MAG: hypothetical protein AAF183_20130 [Pseudomonadota bacterium]